MKTTAFSLLVLLSLAIPAWVSGSEGNTMEKHHVLSQKQESIITIAAFTANGDPDIV